MAISDVYESIKDHKFILYKVEKIFCPVDTLSGLCLDLKKIEVDQAALVVRFNRLIKSDLLETARARPGMKVHFDRLDAMLSNCESTPYNILHKKETISEGDVVFYLAKLVLIPLFGVVKIESHYRNFPGVSALHGLKVEALGIGSVNTWHGGTELRVDGCDVVFTGQELGGEDEGSVLAGDEGTSTDTTSAACISDFEGKKDMDDKYKDALCQLVGTCVVNSFIDKNLSPGKNTVVPTVLFNKSKFKICLYDAEKDILLISWPKLLTTATGGIAKNAVLMLWIIVHHR